LATVWADPAELDGESEILEILTDLLDGDDDAIAAEMADRADRRGGGLE
jgi:hypothetical protein